MKSNGIRSRFELDGKVAIITGASKGIGAAIATGLAEFGAKVVVSSRKQEAVDEVSRRLNSEGWSSTAIACHVGDQEQCELLVNRTVEIYGRVDILINNAAVNPFYGPVEQMDLPAYQKIQSINVEALLRLSNLVFPHMKRQGQGSIIHLSSIESEHPGKGMSAYCISKAAVNMLTKTQASEWGKYGIRVNAIAPGLVRTKFSAALVENEQLMSFVRNQVPAGRVAEPEDMAGLAVFLASDAASYCTGSIYTADGGFSISNAL